MTSLFHRQVAKGGARQVTKAMESLENISISLFILFFLLFLFTLYREGEFQSYWATLMLAHLLVDVRLKRDVLP